MKARNEAISGISEGGCFVGKVRRLASTRGEEVCGIATQTYLHKQRNLMDKQYCVYILTNRYNTVLYTGVTNNLKRRVYPCLLQQQQHDWSFHLCW